MTKNSISKDYWVNYPIITLLHTCTETVYMYIYLLIWFGKYYLINVSLAITFSYEPYLFNSLNKIYLNIRKFISIIDILGKNEWYFPKLWFNSKISCISSSLIKELAFYVILCTKIFEKKYFWSQVLYLLQNKRACNVLA